MKQLLIFAIFTSSVVAFSCNKSKDDGPLEIISGKQNVPFTLKNGQQANIEAGGTQLQVRLTNLSSCVTNGVALGTGYIDVTVVQGAINEDLTIAIPKCNFQQSDSLTSVVTKAGKTLTVNAVQYENTAGTADIVKGLGATLTLK